MSIIQEALEKAQSGVKPAVDPKAVDGSSNDAAKTTQSSQKTVKQEKSRSRSFVNMLLPVATLMILAICAIILGAKFLTKDPVTQILKDTSAQDVSYRPIANDDNPVASALIENVKHVIPSGAIKPVTSPELVLNGIMHLDDGPRAIINNAIVGDGDSVSGAKVIKINNNNVVLQYQDVEITLSLK